MRFDGLRLLVLDVDGVLTPGDVSYPEAGGRVMQFHTQDGCAIKRWRHVGWHCDGSGSDAGGAGHLVAILSGRENAAVVRRAEELGIEHVLQGIGDKRAAMIELLDRVGCKGEEACFVGDDHPDLPAMDVCGFSVAVANAVPEVKRRADFVTRKPGGGGAVAEAIEWLLRKQGQWSAEACC